MKTTELRVGNVVICENQVDAIIAIEGNIGCVKGYGYERYVSIKTVSMPHPKSILYAGNLKFLELTEEILLHIGFKKSSLNNCYYLTRPAIKTVLDKNWQPIEVSRPKRFYIWKNNGRYPNKDEFCIDKWFEKYIGIKYFHQLQNVYYALTGEELYIREFNEREFLDYYNRLITK